MESNPPQNPMQQEGNYSGLIDSSSELDKDSDTLNYYSLFHE